MIKTYLTNFFVFSDTLLLNMRSEKIEPVIEDSTMINLVIFSASWCNPCHEQIPALKEIYQKLKGKINMMYISLDKSETVNNWKALMEEEQIPWRILLATNDVEAIQKKYYAKSIPRIYIIYPDKHFELLDVSEKADIDKLYYLANSYSF